MPKGWRWATDREMAAAFKKLRRKIKPCFHCGMLAAKDSDRLYRDRCTDCWKEAGIKIQREVQYTMDVPIYETHTLVRKK